MRPLPPLYCCVGVEECGEREECGEMGNEDGEVEAEGEEEEGRTTMTSPKRVNSSWSSGRVRALVVGSGKRGLICVGSMTDVNGSGEYAQGAPRTGPSPMAGRVARVRVRINVMRRARWGEEGMMMMAPKKKARQVRRRAVECQFEALTCQVVTFLCPLCALCDTVYVCVCCAGHSVYNA